MENHPSLRSAYTAETFLFSSIDSDYGNHHEKISDEIYDMNDIRWMIWDERYEMNCMHAVPQLTSRPQEPTELNHDVHSKFQQDQGQHSETHVWARDDISAFCHRDSIIQRAEHGDILITYVIIVIAYPSGFQASVYSQLSQSEVSGVIRVMHSAAQWVICLLLKKVPWNMLYKERIPMDCQEVQYSRLTRMVNTVVYWMSPLHHLQYLRQKSVHMGTLNSCYWLTDTRRDWLDSGPWHISS